MYDDMILKLDFYKQNLIKEYIKNGIYPDDNVIQNKLNNIDLGLALFKHTEITSGTDFDVDMYNKEIYYIYQDLCYLYKLLQNTILSNIDNLQTFANTHLQDLNTKATECSLRVKEEISTTSLGNTLLFKSKGFNISTNNNIVNIDIGSINLSPFSKIACICNIDNVESGDISCVFSNDSNKLIIAPYNYNQDTVVIPGSVAIQTYNVNLNSNQIVNGSIQMTISDTIDSEGEYLIFGAKDKVMINSYDTLNSGSATDRPTDSNAVTLDKDGTIDFYTIGASKITFWFSEKPIHANFPLDNYSVSNLNHIQHFIIDAAAGFSFKFSIDNGVVYAIKTLGLIANKKLYFTGDTSIRDFYIEYYTVNTAEKYNLILKAYVNNSRVPIVNSVTVKQLGIGEV